MGMRDINELVHTYVYTGTMLITIIYSRIIVAYVDEFTLYLIGQ